MVFDSQSLKDSLSDLSSEGQPIVTLESQGESESRDNLANNVIITSRAFFEEQGSTSTHSVKVSTRTRAI
jgi:hypothetical protein